MAKSYEKGKYSEGKDKPQDKEDTQNLTAKGKKAFKKADKKQPKSTKKTMEKDNAWDEAKIDKISKKPGMSKKKADKK
jgi:3-oxoacyl-[acyl-carrier-protein] synthase III